MDLREALTLYLVMDLDAVHGDPIVAADLALRGGVTMLQLRGKNRTDRELLGIAIDLRKVCARYTVPFIVNDRLDIALAAGADGVHLGVDDLPLSAARAVAGKGFIIGYSPETDEQITGASFERANYLGIGPVYATSTKSDAGKALGLEEFARRVRLANLPTVGIGGINASNASDVLAAGADGVAVISAILSAPDIERAARQLSRNS